MVLWCGPSRANISDGCTVAVYLEVTLFLCVSHDRDPVASWYREVRGWVKSEEVSLGWRWYSGDEQD